MKTITINNKDFTFETSFAQRISDDAKYGYARVLVYVGNNNIEKLKEWYINFEDFSNWETAQCPVGIKRFTVTIKIS